MRDGPVEPLSAELERLLAAEREILPEAEGLRARALERAQTAFRDRRAFPVRLSQSRRAWLLAAAVGTAFAAVSFAGFHALGPSSEPSVPTPRVDENPRPPPTVVDHPREAEVQSTPRAPASAAEPPAPKKSERDAAPRRSPTADAHNQELGVLQRARAAVASGQFSTALEAIAEHQRRFPAGLLQEEREALRVKALAGLGETEDARKAARRFRERFPNSVLSPRLDEAPQKAP